MRKFKNIKQSELRDAIVLMLDKLNISGPILGEYDIYRAVIK